MAVSYCLSVACNAYWCGWLAAGGGGFSCRPVEPYRLVYNTITEWAKKAGPDSLVASSLKLIYIYDL